MKRNFHLCEVVDADKCKGCTNCVKVCPTEAIRVRNGKSYTLKEKCINCGSCIRICPYHAKIAITDPLDMKLLKKFKCNIALVSPVLYAQFERKIAPEKILNSFLELGFDMVLEEALGADAYTIAVKEYLKKRDIEKPLISSVCPSVLKLIMNKFPNLVENIIPLIPPMEIAAKIARARASNLKNIPEDQIGVFMVTPCAAKAVAIKHPIGLEKSNLDGAVSLLHVFSKIVNKVNTASERYDSVRATAKAVGFAKSGGETRAVNAPNYLVADGIRDVITLLDEMDMGSFNNVDFIECRVCNGGSVGGPLTYQNQFLARIAVRDLSKRLPAELCDAEKEVIKNNFEAGYYDNNKVIEALPVLPLHPNMNKAIELVKKSEEVLRQLPSLDCGSCGTPNCRTLAEDVALGRCEITDCIFKRLEGIELGGHQ